MKNLYFVKELVRLIPLLAALCGYSQSKGDLAFTAINADGNDDFAIVLLNTIPANTVVYFTDASWDNATTSFVESGNDGYLQWDSGNEELPPGTVISFNDINNSSLTSFGVSLGSIVTSNAISLVATGETLLAYLGTNKDNPTTFLTGIKNASLVTNELLGTGLTAGVDFLELNPFTSPDGGEYTGSRTNQSNYADYLSLLTDKSNWTINNSNGELFLDFSKEAFCLIGSASTWTGNTSSVWELADNWSNGIPNLNSEVSISKVSNLPVVTSNAFAGNIILNSGASISIDGSLKTKGLLTAKSGSSVLVLGTLNSSLNYIRELESTNWYLIASPLKNQKLEDFIHKNSFSSGTSTNIGLAPYINEDASWNYQNLNSNGTLDFGKGYSVKLNDSGSLTFSGEFQNTDVSIPLTVGTANGFNLIGNPYSSFLPANSSANGSLNILSVNADQLSEQTLWFWDQKNNGYTAVNQASEGKYISPTQGFFVKSKTEGGLFSFTKAMQSHQFTELFLKNDSDRAAVFLSVTNGDTSKTTAFYFLDGATTDFDNGYDSSSFKGTESSFELTSRLMRHPEGTDLSIQTLPKDTDANLVIPIGLKSGAATLTFTGSSKNLPEDISVYLEDRELAVFYKLENTSPGYTITTDTAITGAGRFFLHTKNNSVLSTSSYTAESFSMYLKDKSTLVIEGLSQDPALVELSNILGATILKKQFRAAYKIQIQLPLSVHKGLYLVSIKVGLHTYTKKIYINR